MKACSMVVISRCTLVGLALLSSTGCTKTFMVPAVPSPEVLYAQTATPSGGSLAVADARGASDKPLNIGRLNVVLVGMSDEIVYLRQNLVRVLTQQGIPVVENKSDAPDMTLEVRKFRIRNRRTSGFAPYITFTTFSADLKKGGEVYRITSYFKNGKVPMWAFREVERPCYQAPIQALVQEVAAKINARVFGRIAPTATVNQLAARATASTAGAGSEEYFLALELGYTNNPAAVAPLAGIVNGKGDSMMRAAAVSALGILRAKEQFQLLKRAYETDDDTVKFMALKSIGDLDTPESKAFIASIRSSSAYENDMVREVVDLYQ